MEAPERKDDLESRLVGIEGTVPELRNRLNELTQKVSKLSQDVGLSKVTRDADRDDLNKRIEEMERKSEDDLNSLAAVVNIHRDSFNRDLAALQSRIDQIQRMVSKLHVCPDCGASLHLHRLEKDSWHLECLLCGYYSVNCKYPKWKEQSGKHPIPLKQ